MNAKAANWMAGVVLPVLLVAGCAVDGLASSRTRALADGDVDLLRRTPDGEVRLAAVLHAGEGVPFGYRVDYRLEDGALVECFGRFGRYRCEGGWRPIPRGA